MTTEQKLQFTLVSQEDGTENITVVVPGQPVQTAHSSHPNWEKIRAGVLANDESVIPLFDLSLTAGMKFERLSDRVTVSNGMMYLDGERVNDALAKQVVRFIMDGVDDWKPLVNFFERVQANPNENSREELYTFITENNLTLTENGLIVGYKGLKKDGTGFYPQNTSGMAIVDGTVFKGKIYQGVGSTVEMPRSEVVYAPNYACHIGLHVGNYKTASGSIFGGNVFEVHVDPRDVVSVPTSGEKMRVCRYVIVKQVKAEITKAVVKDAKSKKGKQGGTPKVNGNIDPSVRVGDVYEDRDKRRAGRQVKVVSLADGVAHVEDMTGKQSAITAANLVTRKFKRVKRGKKKN